MSTESTIGTEMWKARRGYSSYKPISMIPAGGWQAVYAYYDERDSKYAHAGPLIALVLAERERTIVHENGRRETTNKGNCIMGYNLVEGTMISPVDIASNFIAYLAPGALIPDYMEQEAKEYMLSHEDESAEEESTNEREP